ncbi:MAG: sigma-70 family RNA polymerase sigma factor [Vicingaceae bacterium]
MKDKELLNLYYVEGKKHYAFNLMVRAYSKRLYWQIRRLVHSHEDADDILQNTFIKVWKGLPNFRADSKLYSWMYRIATNEALNHLKQHKISASGAAEEHLNQLKDDPYFNGDEAYQKLITAVDQLPDKQKLVFNLRYFEQLPYQEMVYLVGGTEGSLKASYHHAMQKVKDFLLRD